MRGVRSLSSGLFIGLIIASTVFGALVLSVRGQPTSISELPIPTVTLQIVFTSPTPTHTTTRAAIQPAAPSAVTAPSASPSVTPTPTICPISPSWQRYIVGPFDTVVSIAQRFNLAPDQLVKANCLDTPGVTVGQTIYVPGFKPTSSPSAPCFPPFNWSRYIVRPGDTLSSIAVRYSISVYTLMRANCLSTTFIYYGQVLYVPPTVPIVIFTPTPIIPTFTLIPPTGSPWTPTPRPPADTPTATTATTPAITVTPGPTDTPGATGTPVPTDTPAPTVAPTGPSPITDTPVPTAAPTEPSPPASTPAPTVAPTEPPLPTIAPTEPPANTPLPALPANTPEPLPEVTTLP